MWYIVGVPTRDELLAAGLRHDPQRARQSVRQAGRKDVRISIAGEELRKAGIDPDGPPPKFRVWVDPKRKGSVQIRFYS